VKNMNFETLRPVLAPFAGAVMCLALMPRPDAAVPGATGATAAQFVARALDPADAKDAGPVEIVIRRWSTDADAESLRKTLSANAADQSTPMFRPVPEAGIVLVPGVQGLGARVRDRRPLTVQFARDIVTAAGRQIVIATDHRIALGEPQPSSRLGVAFEQMVSGGRAADAPRLRSEAEIAAEAASHPEFMLLEIRLGPDGKGVGKTASAADVVYDKDKKTFEIKNYTAAPVRLSDVRPVDRP
jgi:hypothetical protein